MFEEERELNMEKLRQFIQFYSIEKFSERDVSHWFLRYEADRSPLIRSRYTVDSALLMISSDLTFDMC